MPDKIPICRSGDVQFDDKIIKTPFSGLMLISALNTGQLIMP